MPEARPKRIGFFTDGPPFDGRTLEERALGGSETALIQAAGALAERGHEVTVFNNCRRRVEVDGVVWRPRSEFVLHSVLIAFDVFIVSRFYGFFNVPFRAGLNVLWNHDTLDRPKALRAVLDRIDTLLVLSEFHRDNFLTRLPEFDEGRFFVTRNGIDLDLIDAAAVGTPKDPGRVIYASRPERGLKVLLENIWPRLIQARPKLTLYLCGYDVDRGDLEPGLAELYGYLDSLVRVSKNVVRLGSLTKKEYYRTLARSSLMVYPCNFPEISCIAALEAQACRTPILTTDGFALSETVKVPRFKVPGRPGTESYDRLFIERALGLLSEPETAAVLAERARAAVEERYTWPAITAEWDRLFDLALASRYTRPFRGPSPEIRRHGPLAG